ncbi:hypothetical protein BH11CYA1_BH11CYA1_00930 [soil metagenome]
MFKSQSPQGFSLTRYISVICCLTATLFSATPAQASSAGELQKLFGGIASWYGGRFHGRRTASGGIYDMNKLTCAHKTLPFGTKLLIFNPQNGKEVEVVVTDRGPYVGKRIIDLSKAAADKLNISGIGNVVCMIRKGASKPKVFEPAYKLHGELEIADSEEVASKQLASAY